MYYLNFVNYLKIINNGVFTVKVRKAVIPAAGLGTRFLPATKAQPKEMLPILVKPNLIFFIKKGIGGGVGGFLFFLSKKKKEKTNPFLIFYVEVLFLGREGGGGPPSWGGGKILTLTNF